MTKGMAILGGMLLLGLFAACGGEEPQPTPSPSPAVTLPSPTPQPTPTPTPEVERAPRLIFLRSQLDGLGVIHMSDLDGSNVIQLTPADILTSFVGLAERDGSAILYYVSAGQTGNVFTLEARDLGTGETTNLASIEATYSPRADLSPDGRYIAFTHGGGIDLLDLTTGERRRLLENEECVVLIQACWAYDDPQWAPAGDIILVQKDLWEATVHILVRPFQSPVGVIETAYGFGRPDLSPDGEQLCIWESFGIGGSALVIYHIPTGEVTDVLPNLPPVGPEPDRVANVLGCSWSEDRRLAVGYSPDVTGPGRIAILDSDFNVIADSDTIESVSGVVDWLPDGSGVVFNGDQPSLLDASGGTHTFILQPGDRVVAVTQPIALPEGIVAAAPEVRPCAPLIAGCEAQVTNVAPQRLNVRVGPGTEATLTGKLSEGDVVCLTGSSALVDGFRWWPLHSQGEEARWVAQGDSEEPEEPWLTPTGRKCPGLRSGLRRSDGF